MHIYIIQSQAADRYRVCFSEETYLHWIHVNYLQCHAGRSIANTSCSRTICSTSVGRSALYYINMQPTDRINRTSIYGRIQGSVCHEDATIYISNRKTYVILKFINRFEELDSTTLQISYIISKSNKKLSLSHCI